jgi:hypothetical protein
MRPTARLLLALALTLVAAPALAYTIYLKDGSQLVAKQKYEVRGDKAIIVLPSGTETAIKLSEIDVQRTDKANVDNIGTAVLLDSAQGSLSTNAAPPPTASQKLESLIRTGAAGVNAGSATGAAPPATAGAPPQRPRGFDENAPVVKLPALHDTALAAQLKGFIGGRGLPVEVVQGNAARRPLLVYDTDAEGPVFRALLTSAAALIEAQHRLPGTIDGVEVLCRTSDGGTGARFNLSPEQAADLLAGRAEITHFFVDNVVF